MCGDVARRRTTTTYSDREKKAIQAELLRCRGDLEYFCRHWVRIPADRGIVPFVWLPSQVQVHNKLCDGKPLIIVKERQFGGCSTYMAARNLHAILFFPGEHVLVIAQHDKTAVRLGAMYRSMWENLPDWMRAQWCISRPQDGAASDTFTEFFFGPGLPKSSWQVHTANSEAVRAASNITRQHLTEVAFWDDPVKTMAAVGQTSATITNPELVFESTANGPNWYYETWQNADPKRGGYNKLFLTWLGDPRCKAEPLIPTSEWEKEIQANPAPGYPPLTPEEFGWVVRTRDTLCGGQDSMFDQEYPTTVERAFVLSGRPYFEGVNFPEAYTYTDRAEDAPEWRREGHDKPKSGHVYVIGADPASGAPWPADGSAAVVLDVTDVGNMPVVCTANVRESQENFARRVADLYREWGCVLAVPERSLGLTLVDALATAKCRVYHEQVWDKGAKAFTSNLGWMTTGQSRPLMLGRLHSAVVGGRIDPGDVRLKAHINNFRHGRSRAEAAPGKKDDLVIALALCVVGLPQVIAPRQEIKRRRPRTFEEQFDMELKAGKEYDPTDPAFGGTGIPPVVPVGFTGY